MNSMNSKNKRRLNKVLAVLLTLCIGVSMFPASVFAAELGGTPDSEASIDAGSAVVTPAPEEQNSESSNDSSSESSSGASSADSSAADSNSAGNSSESSHSDKAESNSESQNSEDESTGDANSESQSSSEDASSDKDNSATAGDPVDSDSPAASNSSADSSSGSQAESQDQSSSTPEDSSSLSEADPSNPEGEAESPNEPESSVDLDSFTALTILDPESSSFEAEPGDQVTFTAKVNRDDIKVSYQWQRIQAKPAGGIASDVLLYDYEESQPTFYSYRVADMTEAEYLSAYPEATWQGVEMYYAIMAALDEIGADTSDIQLAWRTPNYVLDGWSISAAYVGDIAEIYADKDGERAVATLNSEGKWEFADAAQYVAEWKNIEGANAPEYTFTVENADYGAMYRCAVTVLDDDYKEACKAILASQGVTLTDEQAAAEQILYSVSMSVTDPYADLVIEDAPVYLALENNTAVVGFPKLSDDAQWITGLTGSYEYITKDTYDRVTKWLNEGKITETQADYYWTVLNSRGFGGAWYANVLNEDGFPTGETRLYNGFNLTDGKLEVNSEWYGKTVYFRMDVDGKANWGTTGTAINVPAYTELSKDADGNYIEAASGTRYKKAITLLNPYVFDTGSVYKDYLRLGYISTPDGWLYNEAGNVTDNHVTVYAITAESFNSDPARFMVDAEGNYRVDSVAWGVCTYEEPDISGKAYHVLKDFLANGYGFLIGHDTMYAYAGAYYDAFGVDLKEYTVDANGNKTWIIDPNDGETWYYDLNRWLPGTTGSVYKFDESGQNIVDVIKTSTTRGGHFYLNELLGSNAGNVNSDTVSPSDAPSLILSTGGSHGEYGKKIMYGGNELRVVQTAYTAEQAKTNAKYRTPTNYPYKFTAGEKIPAVITHTNQQASFGTLWVEYSGGNEELVNEFGVYEDQMFWTVDGSTGTNNFYLAGTGNFLMNQVGHLKYKALSAGEAKLFTNSVFYVSQRKQCEVCAAGQDGQETVHFVHRINSANADAILSVLQDGGNYWYSLDDCYMLTDDIVLGENWTSIKNFSGHWNSDVYDVTLNSKGTPLLENTETPAGKYNTGSSSGWNLGADQTAGVENVFQTNGSGIRTTGVARVVGDLNDLFGTEISYAGYTVKILGSDNTKYLSSGEEYSCIVNTDSKYVISNLPCIYNADTQTGILRARVYKPDGSEVTEYGVIRVNVEEAFWDNDMTTPLYLGAFQVGPIKDADTYESSIAVFTANTSCGDQPTLVGWQYRVDESSAWTDVPSSWGTVNNTAGTNAETGDHTLTTVLTLTDVDPAWNGYEFRAVFSSQTQGTWSTYDYYQKNGSASLTDNGGSYKKIAEADKSGKLTVKLWPARTSQGYDQSVYEGNAATFTSQVFLLDADGVIDYKWQYSTQEWNIYTGQYDTVWHDVAGSSEFGATASVTKDTVTKATDSVSSESGWNTIKNAYPSVTGGTLDAFNQNATFWQVDTALKVSKVDILQNNTQFRVVYTAESKYGTEYTVESDVADELNWKWVNTNSEFDELDLYGQKANAKRSNILTVLPPDLFVNMQEANKFTDSAENVDMSDPLGQLLVVPDTGATVADGTAVYRAFVYYLPEEAKPTVSWQYRTYKNASASAWNQAACNALGYTGATVTVTNTDKGQEEIDGETYNVIESVMTIKNAPLSMYNMESLLKYYFRCIAESSYETSKGVKTQTQVDSRAGYQWGGLSMDYAISIKHNGVLGYGGSNQLKVTGSTAGYTTVTSLGEIVDASVSTGGITWKYPKLEIEVPDGQHINTVMVWFDQDYAHSASDYIGYTTSKATEYGITANLNDEYCVFTATTLNAVETATWEQFLRSYVWFVTYDDINYSNLNSVSSSVSGGAKIKWHVDELRLSGATIDPSSGKAYEVKTTSSAITWANAKTAAEKYNSAFGVNGHLVQIDDATENALVKDLLGGKTGWIGGTKNNSAWKWANGSTYTNMSYKNWASGEPASDTSKIYTVMNSAGTWAAYAATSSSSTTRTYTDLVDPLGWTGTYIFNWSTANKEEIYMGSGQSVTQSVNLINGHTYYIHFYGHDGGGDGNIACDFVFSPFNVKTASGPDDKTNVSKIAKFTGTTGNYTITAKAGAEGIVMPAGHSTMFTRAAVIDLTAAGGDIPTLAWCEANLQSFGGSKDFTTTTQVQSDVKAYVVEYDLDALGVSVSNHSAEDGDYIGRNSTYDAGTKVVSAVIKGNQKVYDKKVLAPASFTFAGDDGASLSLFNVTYTLVNGMYSGYTAQTVNGANWQSTNIINSGVYHATVSLTAEAEAAGWTLDADSSTLECDLSIMARPVDVYSYNNDKTYDSTSTGTIENIAVKDASGDRGVVAGDTVKFNTTTVTGYYTSDGVTETVHNSVTNSSDGYWIMLRNTDVSDLYILHDSTSDPHHNYYLASEDYTGAIEQRPVVVHSLYRDDPDKPRNVKEYDGTTKATITDILIDNVIGNDELGVKEEIMAGVYEKAEAGETLDPDGTVQTDRLKKLDEYIITADTKAELTGNDHNDYYIEKEEYSGAITRAVLEARVKSWVGVYGTGLKTAPWHDTEAYAAGKKASAGCWLAIDGLIGSDTLLLDSAKSQFAVLDVADSSMTITETTPVGSYPLTYEGLTEQNYPVLSNYIVAVFDGTLRVEPREVLISVDDADKMVGDANPAFHSSFAMRKDDDSLTELGSDSTKAYTDMALCGTDTVASVITVRPKGAASTEGLTMSGGVSNIGYSTDCTADSPVQYESMTDYSTFACDFCEDYHGTTVGTDHWKLAGYEVKINTNKDAGNVLDVVYVTNPLGEDVQNYEITYMPGAIRVHPELRFQLEATVPLVVCMYGYRGTGEVIEPTNYGITNYSNGAIKISNIGVSNDGWALTKDLDNLIGGQMYMNMNGTVLELGDNAPHDPTKWIAGKAADHENRIGTYLDLPLECRIAGGDVNEAKEAYVVKICYTIAEYGKTLPVSNPTVDQVGGEVINP